MNIVAAIGAIEDGAVVGIPTDTVYGLAVDPLNSEAVSRLYELKGRPPAKPIGLLAAGVEQVVEIAEMSEAALSLAKRFWPGGLTLIVTPKVVLADWVGDRHLRTVGLRVPNYERTIALLEATGPLAVTSANRSGGPETTSDDEARAIFGDDVAGYVSGTCPGGVASTVVDVTSDALVVLRHGALDLDDLT